MKRFDYAAWKQRFLKRLRVKEEWAMLVEDGTISNVTDVIAENFSELSRYLEFQAQEKKWANAKTSSALTHQAGLISYKKERARSATGYVIVSHTDITGKDRLSNYGTTFFDLDAASDYDNIDQNKNSSYTEKQSLVPWTFIKPYTVPKGTRFISQSGIEYISTKDMSIRPLNNAYSEIKNNASLETSFLRNGGWNGIKYLKVPVVQGKLKSTAIGETKTAKFQTFVIPSSKVEAANNSLTRQFFKILVNNEEWVEIQNIKMSGPYDKVFEAKLLDDDSGVLIKFGDGTCGQIPTEGQEVVAEYLETMGSEGNCTDLYQITKMIFPDGYSMRDPRKNTVTSFLSCTNSCAISGGYDIPDVEDIRANAPVTYLKSYTTGTEKEYNEKIRYSSPISLLNFKLNTLDDIDIYDVNQLEENIASKIIVSKNAIGITALDSAGNIIENAQSDFIVPLLYAMSQSKSPTYTMRYIEPNMIKFGVNLKLSTKQGNTSSDEQIIQEEKATILNEYGIQSVDFTNSVYQSNITSLSELFDYVKKTQVFINAIADYDVEDVKYSTNYDYFLVPFKFDKTFIDSSDDYGLKNNIDDGFPYVVRCDVKFKNNAEADKYSKTLFLIDSRNDDDLTLEDTKFLIEDSNQKAVPTSTFDIEGITVNVWNSKDTRNSQRLVRTVQFGYLSNIADESFIKAALDYSSFPYEQKYLEVDSSTGEFASFLVNTITNEELRYFPSGKNDGQTSCYKINEKFIDGYDIIFNENYDLDDDSVASGYLVCPIAICPDLPTILQNSESNKKKEAIISYLKSYVDFEFSALPKSDQLISQEWNDIIFTDEDNIKIEIQ